LNDIIPILGDSYNGIDIRAVLARSTRDDRWYYVLLKIRLTTDSPIKIQGLYDKKKNELGSIDRDDFRVVFHCKNIQQLDAFLNEIQNGPIRLGTITASPMGKEFQNIFENLQVYKNGIYSTEHEREGFNNLMAFISGRERPEALVRQLGVRIKDYNMKFNEISSWLDTEPMALGHSNYIIIVLPLYCKLLGGPFSSEARKFLAKYSVHRSMQRHCAAIVKRNYTELIKRLEFKDLELLQNSSDNHDEMDTLAIPMIEAISAGTFVQIEIRHDNLGEICTDRMTVPVISQRKVDDDRYPLYRVLKFLEAWEKIPNYLLSNDPKTQVSATTWLLTLLGFNCINLGAIDREDENIKKQGKARLHSIDIISYNPSNKLFLACDCTINPPPLDKIDKIRNAASLVSQENRCLVPVIFCNKDCSTSYQHAKNTGVYIVDINGITRLSSLILSGQIDEANTLILTLVTS
jgi:hypothetical protein